MDFGASEIPYGVQDGSNFDPPPTRGYAYLPDTAGATAFVYNLSIGGQRVTGLRLSSAVIGSIFTGVITLWDDPRIAADNPGLSLPATMITPVVHAEGSAETAEFTQWMVATQGSYWTAYCARVGFAPCTQTSSYLVLPDSAMVGQAGDLGVAGYVVQTQADGAIGYVESASALGFGLPAAKVLNAAGYYTAPTVGNVEVALLKTQVHTNPTDPLDGIADLSHNNPTYSGDGTNAAANRDPYPPACDQQASRYAPAAAPLSRSAASA